MKIVAILFALLIAHQTCHSLPISESDEDTIPDIVDISDDSSESDDAQINPQEGKFVQEFLVDPEQKKNVVLFDNTKGIKSSDNKKTGSVNINSFSDDDSDADDDDENSSESDSDEIEKVEEKKIESSSSEDDLLIVKEKKQVAKVNIEKSEESDLGKAPIKALKKVPEVKVPVKSSIVASGKVAPKTPIKTPIKASEKVSIKAPIKASEKASIKASEKAPIKASEKASIKASEKAPIKDSEKAPIKASEKTPVRTPIRTFKKASSEEKIDSLVPFKRPIPAGQGKPYVRKANQNAPKKPLPFTHKKQIPQEKKPEDFEKEIDELKKEIQRMRALGQSESSEDDETAPGKDEPVDELIKDIKNLRDEIKVEKGLGIESSEENDAEIDDDEDSDESSDENDADDSDETIETKAKKPETSSNEQDGIKNIKFSQTFDGKDEPSSESVIVEEKEDKKSVNFDNLVKIIESLKEEIKEERRKEVEDFVEGKMSGEEYLDHSEESVDEHLLSIFEDLENNENLKDIKHFNDEKDQDILVQQKPLLEIEKPENLKSEEVKIGLFIDENSNEEKQIDLIKDNSAKKIVPQRIADIEVVPVFLDFPPVQFPNDFVQFIEVVEIPEIGVSKTNEVINDSKKSEIAKKNVPDEVISGGILSKVGSIFDFVKKRFT